MLEVLRRLWEGIMPVVGMVVFVTSFIVGLFIFSYFLIIGAIIGLILFIVAFIRLKIAQHKRPKEPPSGRIIEHDETEK